MTLPVECGGLGSSLRDTHPDSAKTVADILTAAAKLIEPEGAWTQGGFARASNGTLVRIFAPDAVCFCAVGAIERVSGDRPTPSYSAIRAMELLSDAARCGSNIGHWNDAPARTQAEVVAALREAARVANSASPGLDGEEG